MRRGTLAQVLGGLLLSACGDDWPGVVEPMARFVIEEVGGEVKGEALLGRLEEGRGLHAEMHIGQGAKRKQQVSDLLLGPRGLDGWRTRRNWEGAKDRYEIQLGPDGLFWEGRRGMAVEKAFLSGMPDALSEGSMDFKRRSFGGSFLGLAALVAGGIPEEGRDGRAFNGISGLSVAYRIEKRERRRVTIGDREILADRAWFWTSTEGHTIWAAEGELLYADGFAERLRVRREDFVFPVAPPAPEPEPFDELPISVERGDVHLAGTFCRPRALAAPVPAVLLVAGSGPLDRDGGIPGLGSGILKPLAEAFAHAGIPSLRYDKRGVGESFLFHEEGSMTLDDLVGDARAWVERLMDMPEVAGVFALGHSEGGYIVTRVALERPELMEGVIMMAGPARRLDAVIRDQTEAMLGAAGFSRDAIDETLSLQKTLFRRLQEGPARRRMLDPSGGVPANLSEAWLRSHLANEATENLKALKVPLLAVYAQADLQVLPAVEVPVLEAALMTAENPDVSIEVLPGLDHLFMETRGPLGTGIYADPDRRLPPAVERKVVAWVARRAGLAALAP